MSSRATAEAATTSARSLDPLLTDSVDGDWTLKVVDGAARDIGSIRAVSLHLTGFESG